MKRLINFPASLLCVFALLFGVSVIAANLPSDWQRVQSFDVSTTGLVKVSLPIETLDAARPELEDLRLYDEAGNEVPYLIERPMPAEKVAQAVKGFQVSLNASTTVITVETGLAQPLDTVTLETPAMGLSKRCAWKVPKTATAGKHSRKASRFFVSPTAQVICKFPCRRAPQNGSALPSTTGVRRRSRSPVRSSIRPLA